MALPQPQDLRVADEAEQIKTLDLLFEPSPAIHSTLLPIVRDADYTSYPELIEACRTRLASLASLNSSANPDETLLSILGSHPRLGAKKVDSAQSAAEQANLQGQGEELAKLNKEYEEKFTGLRYVVFVNGRGRPEIMENMKARISRGDFSKEVDEALQAMCDIANDRASKLGVKP
ncbi:Oxo-4-hydroxy-4-carboxy-5-ureidoimidazoline decarboxylase [Fusarium agapanthi]|uniref:Oxo-4-hydroxy-4-carboxy-5-ureidoimidazoline decarboxylase n=1 Tax=Fusarium agapanthi TaxID=1803897 RepID=A0A9P5BIR8_9HYPO|nr:Oxo-4-hydroxy-4-carboxy-5-ureidoimidazoline decarboxylase [Fusarium agapanthi]